MAHWTRTQRMLHTRRCIRTRDHGLSTHRTQDLRSSARGFVAGVSGPSPAGRILVNTDLVAQAIPMATWLDAATGPMADAEQHALPELRGARDGEL